jgi:hypothetical protein
VSGLVVAGFGGGAFIFDQLQTAYLNPDNKATDQAVGGDKYDNIFLSFIIYLFNKTFHLLYKYTLHANS